MTSVPVPETSSLPFYQVRDPTRFAPPFCKAQRKSHHFVCSSCSYLCAQNVLTSTFTVNTTITTEITQVVTSVQFFNVTSVWTSTYTLPTVFPEGTGPGSLYSVTPPMTTVTGTSIFPMSSSSAPEVTAVINPPRKEKRVLRVRRVPPRADDEE